MEENYKLAQWLDDSLDNEELAQLQATSNFDVLEKIKHYSGQLTTSDFDHKTMLTQVLKAHKKNPKVIPIYNNWLFRVACTLLLFLGIGYLSFNSTENQLAKNGEKNSFFLPDQSQVVLNSDSEIDYKKWNWDNNRKLELKGEAFFKVAKGKKFEVNTTLGKVTVLGTQFNVKARDNRFDIICYEGKVKVNYQNNQIILTKNQSVTFENGKQIDNTNVIDAKPSWLEDEIAFHKNNLTAVIKEIERNYNIKITNKDNNDKQVFSGKIPSNNLPVALEIITSTFHLKPTKVSENEYILQP